MANIPTNPYISGGTTLDTSISESTYSTSDMPVVTSNSHVIQSRGDQSLWDVTAGAFVSIQNTTVGTTTVPKWGQ